MTRFVVCGEALIDLVRAENGPHDTFSSTWQALSAGGPMNSAVALGRLGHQTHFLGRLSNDAFGQQLAAHIETAGVGLDLATVGNQSTSIAVVSLDDQGKASYAFHFADTANFSWRPEELPVLSAADWLHIASLALVVDPGAEVLLRWTEQTEALLSVDVNVRPSVIPDPGEYWRRIEPWVAAVGRRGGLVKASDEDVEFLARAGAHTSWRDVARRWTSDYGAGLVLVTRGAGGASALAHDGDWVEVDGFPTDVVDTVGAGDTFMAGFLDAWVAHDADLATALTRGAAAASIVCSRQGAQPPTAAEVDALVASRR